MNSRRGSTTSPISVLKICVGGDRVFDPHLQQAAGVRVHRGFPQLFRVHFAEALEALDLAAFLGFFQQPGLGLGETGDGFLARCRARSSRPRAAGRAAAPRRRAAGAARRARSSTAAAPGSAILAHVDAGDQQRAGLRRSRVATLTAVTRTAQPGAVEPRFQRVEFARVVGVARKRGGIQRREVDQRFQQRRIVAVGVAGDRIARAA
jgi:hypothetical protein